MCRFMWFLLLMLGFPAFAFAAAPTPITKVDSTHTVTVDCRLKRSIAAGKYDVVYEDITLKRFPESACKAGAVEISLIHLGRETRTPEVLAELDRLGFRPANLPELLALGAAHPSLQTKFYIVALGSSLQDPDGGNMFPYLNQNVGFRELLLSRGRSLRGWDANGRFAAVRK